MKLPMTGRFINVITPIGLTLVVLLGATYCVYTDIRYGKPNPIGMGVAFIGAIAFKMIWARLREYDDQTRRK